MNITRLFHLICFVCFSVALAPRLSAQGGLQPVRAKHVMVASAEEHASQVGVEMNPCRPHALLLVDAKGNAVANTYMLNAG